MSVEVGTRLPLLEVALDRTRVVATAIATRDFQPLHHDPDYARERGLEDVFINIHTSNGLVQRFVTDWAGPDAFVRSSSIRLGVPAYAGDTLRFEGAVSQVSSSDAGLEVTVAVSAHDRLGEHLSGSVEITLPAS